MANYKLVDADQLDADLKAVADKIREKGNTTDELSFPQAYIDAVDAIQTGGGGVAEDKRYVNFYDYEGTLLYSYSKDEVEALTELPPLPSHDGLICQGWNWSLEDIKAEGKETNVGAMYITDDGKTRLYITIEAEGRMDVPLYFKQTVANGVTIDWGDGSATETLSGVGNVNTTHTYASIGNYIMSLDVAEGCALSLGRDSSYGAIGTPSNGTSKASCGMLRKVEIGKGVTSIVDYAFSACYFLENITIPDGMNSIKGSAFAYCRALKSIIIPNGVSNIGSYTFNSCLLLKNIIIPGSVVNIDNQAFLQCYAFEYITIPTSVTSMKYSAFYYCYGLKSITFPNSLTSMSDSIFTYCQNLKSVTIQDGVTSMGASMFSNCVSLLNITIPDSLTSMGNGVFQGCTSLVNIAIPKGVVTINSAAFSGCCSMKFYDFTKHTTVPTLVNTNAFQNIPSDCEIRVPAALYDEWIAATNWSTYAANIVAK